MAKRTYQDNFRAECEVCGKVKPKQKCSWCGSLECALRLTPTIPNPDTDV